MDDRESARAVLLALVRENVWTLVGYVAILGLGVAGYKLGEAYSPWFYLLAVPMLVSAIREVPRSLREAKARQLERERVRAVARERGFARHVRRDK